MMDRSMFGMVRMWRQAPAKEYDGRGAASSSQRYVYKVAVGVPIQTIPGFLGNAHTAPWWIRTPLGPVSSPFNRLLASD